MTLLQLYQLFPLDVAKKKMASIRARFAREIREEKLASVSGSGKRKTAVYVYTRNLSFLRPHMKLRLTKDNMSLSVSRTVLRLV